MRRIARQREHIEKENQKHAQWVSDHLDNITEIMEFGRAKAVHHSDSETEEVELRIRTARRACRNARKLLAASTSATKEPEAKTAGKEPETVDKTEEEARATSAAAEVKQTGTITRRTKTNRVTKSGGRGKKTPQQKRRRDR